MNINTSPAAGKRGLRLPDLKLRTGLGKTAIYARIKDGTLPPPTKLGSASVWPEEAVDAAIAKLSAK